MQTNNNFVVVIPARLASERLPGKVLLDIAGKTMLQRVWERAIEAQPVEVIIATDDERIVTAGQSFGAEVLLTDSAHSSGSDRIAEVALKKHWKPDQIIVNLQGDEPLMPAACLEQVAQLLARHPKADAASLFWPIDDAEEVLNPDVVKVVTDSDGRALLFSRSAIPHARSHRDPATAMAGGVKWKRHLGLYAYRADSLLRFSSMPPSALEQAERLEQLRYLECGGSIVLEQACMAIPPGVDNATDLDRVRRLINDTKLL